jgi:2'-hydroxyisoflavone reductase
MKLLIVGGTRFVGRHIAQQALAQGHALTLFHRGRSGPDLFPHAEHRTGDRDDDLSALAGGTWDAVIDTCAYVPRQVRTLAAALRGRVGHHTLISTISVYAPGQAGCDEDAPRAVLADPATETVDGSTYGGLKALCEDALRDEVAGPRCIVRPGLIVGPHDPTERFTWWVRRMQRGGEVLAPGDPQTPVQLIDVRDLAAFILGLAVAGTGGTFNAVGPAGGVGLTMQGLLDAGLSAAPSHNAGAPVTLRWVCEDFLLERGVRPWTDLPLWLDRDNAGMATTRIDRATAAGLRTRSLAETWTDTAAWAAGVPPASQAVGLTPGRERELLAAWASRGTLPDGRPLA